MDLHADHLRLDAIADSGQCFRWQPLGEGYRIIASGRVLHASQRGDRVTLSCTRRAFDAFWRGYLDLDTDYGAIIAAIPPRDAYLRAAAAHGGGIRILRQEAWETLITFILSQRKSIPAIRQGVERLCAAAGRAIGRENGETLHAFPTPAELSALTEEDLRACGLGYRAPYVRRAAQAFARGEMDMAALSALPDEELQAALCGLYGVGRKIALCTMLFGFHRLNAFPVDVWMEKVARFRYPGGIPLADYAPWGGVMQQYMFAYERALARGNIA